MFFQALLGANWHKVIDSRGTKRQTAQAMGLTFDAYLPKSSR